MSSLATKRITNRELLTGNFAKTDPIYKPAKVRFAGTALSNLYFRNTFATNQIYTNPNVTKEGQENLSNKLHSEIETEEKLTDLFKTRPRSLPPKERKEDSAKIFNDFCVEFIEASKTTREDVQNTLNDAHNRLIDLEDLRQHLEEVERRAYRFEMNLPDHPIISNQVEESIFKEELI